MGSQGNLLPLKVATKLRSGRNRQILGPLTLLGTKRPTQKSLRSVLLPTDHVLKFCKDPFRGVDGSDSKKTSRRK